MTADLASKIFIFSVGGLAFMGIILRAIADVISGRASKKIYRILNVLNISFMVLLPIGACWWLYIVARPDLLSMIFTFLVLAAIPVYLYRTLKKGI